MKHSTQCVLIAAVLFSYPCVSYSDQSLGDAIKMGEAHVSFRLRYEDAEQDTAGGDIEADTFTLRTRLNYKTAAYHSFSSFIEFDDVTALNGVDYRTWPGDTSNPGSAIIADPEGTEVNQFWINYALNKSDFKWGRQRIAIDNHRFVGTVGWRQNEQTYDAFSITSHCLKDTRFLFGHINNVNRIFGENITVGDVEQDTYYFNANYTGLSVGSVTAYAYLIDADDSNTAFDSWDTDTYGLRFSGQQMLKEFTINYSAEYARQSDSNDNASEYDANYWLIEGGVKVSRVSLNFGQEVLGADNSDGFFVTPFATLHKFQGWTDKFLNLGKGNISGGIVDRYVSIGTHIAGVKLLAVFHDFEADDRDVTGDSDLGEEWGILASKHFGGAKGKTYGVTLKYASYAEGDLQNGDTDKLWLMATANF
jgi:Alginate export